MAKRAVADAIADCAIFLMQQSTRHRLDFQTLIAATCEEIMQRDWVAERGDG